MVAPLPDIRRERYWRGPGFADAPLTGVSVIGGPTRAVSESVGAVFSFISETTIAGVERGIEAGGVELGGDEEEMGWPRKVAELGDGGVAGVSLTVGGESGDEAVADDEDERPVAAISRLILTREALTTDQVVRTWRGWLRIWTATRVEYPLSQVVVNS